MDTNGNLRELLLKDLCGRLPYEVAIIPDGQLTPYQIIDIDFNKEVVIVQYKDEEEDLRGIGCLGFDDFKLLLRPMSSMTEEEKVQTRVLWIGADTKTHAMRLIDFYNKNHFDYRGLIEKGLALEASEGMYE